MVVGTLSSSPLSSRSLNSVIRKEEARRGGRKGRDRGREERWGRRSGGEDREEEVRGKGELEVRKVRKARKARYL